jgi:anti-sigma factor ChrR (cupin superfamily)
VEHVDELIAGQALHALSDEDSERVALHVAECDRCRRQLREAEAIAASLAYAVPTLAPPPDLRDRVLAAVEPVVSAPQAAPCISSGWPI